MPDNLTTIAITDIEAIGQLLHGSSWESALASQLDVGDNTLRQWLRGKYQPDAKVIETLVTLAAAKLVETTVLEVLRNNVKDGNTLVIKTDNVPWSAEIASVIQARATKFLQWDKFPIPCVIDE